MRSRTLVHVTFSGVLLRLLTGLLLVYRHSILRAYVIGYLSSTTPRVIASLRQIWRNDLDYQQKRRVVGCSIGRCLHSLKCSLIIPHFVLPCLTHL